MATKAVIQFQTDRPLTSQETESLTNLISSAVSKVTILAKPPIKTDDRENIYIVRGHWDFYAPEYAVGPWPLIDAVFRILRNHSRVIELYYTGGNLEAPKFDQLVSYETWQYFINHGRRSAESYNQPIDTTKE